MQRWGAIWNENQTIWRVWAPGQKIINLILYMVDGQVQSYLMNRDENGVHSLSLEGDYHLIEYIYDLGDQAVVDPYALGLTSNSARGVVMDLSRCEPSGWREHNIPQTSPEEAIIYELHIKDYTYDSNANVLHPGKYLGLAQRGTRLRGLTTGLDHLVELGITHVHLMPVADFITVNENEDAFDDPYNYNWGYDPFNYFVPEGSYATDVKDPTTRIKEFRQMVMALHEAGIKVVMDVVYNHTYLGKDGPLEALAPGQYFRLRQDGTFSDGSGCGNELASERPHVRELIMTSLLHWQREYKIDGFRFDLMGLMDRETAKLIADTLRINDPKVLIYGEPWTAAETTLRLEDRVTKGTQKFNKYSIFNDDFRNAIKGGNDGGDPGFIQGNPRNKDTVLWGIGGSIGGKSYYGMPYESVNYFNSHDNLILEDKLRLSLDNIDKENMDACTKLAFDILLLSKGIVFFHEGNEFRRSKAGLHNTYNSPINLNRLNWLDKHENWNVNAYVVELIKLRKRLACFKAKTYARMEIVPTTHQLRLHWRMYLEESLCLEVMINATKKQWSPLTLEQELYGERTLLWDGFSPCYKPYKGHHVKVAPKRTMVFILNCSTH
ncbi:MAG: type I pullulanase [Tissierellia bacterium]|nr:type I pullulanase [Tissierellia bacterium]